MADLLPPPIDPTHRGGPTVLYASTVLTALPPVPDPGPGDPDVPLATAPRRRHALYAARGGVLLAEFTTFTADATYTRVQLGLRDEMRHHLTVAGDDPAWSLLGAPVGLNGLPEVNRILPGIEWQLWEDRVLVASGFSEGPVDLGAPYVDLQVSGGVAIFRDRYLGDGGLQDLLGGIGSFPNANLDGWTFDPGVTRAWNTTDPYEGGRCIMLRGTGWVWTPWGAAIPASSETLIEVHSSIRARLREEPDALQGLNVLTQIRRVSDGAIVNPNWSEAKKKSTDPDLTGWQAVTAPGRLPTGTGLYQARTGLLVNDNDWTDVDLIRETTRGMTGSLTPVALETILQRVLNRAQQEQCGGDLGVTMQIHTPSGATGTARYLHDRDPLALEALASITDRVDGPDAWMTPDRVMHVDATAGTVRTDLVLNRDTVIDARFTSDPTLQWHDTRVHASGEAGPTREVVGSNSASMAGEPRRRIHTPAPVELNYRATERYAAGYAESNRLPHRQLDATVTGDYGRQFAAGDYIPVALMVRGESVTGQLRVLRVEAVLGDDTCVVSVVLDRET